MVVVCCLVVIGWSSLCNLLVHPLNLGVVLLLGLVSLQLEGRGQKIVLDRELLWRNIDILENLKALEVTLLSKDSKFLLESGADKGLGAELFIGFVAQLVLVGPQLQRLGIRDDDSDEGGLERVAVDKDLSDEVVLGEDGLDLLWSDVFTLGQFEDVLDTVDDNQAALSVPLSDISSAM